MDHVRNEWLAYRQAFEEFSRSVQQVQALTANPNPDRAALDAALLKLEKARENYDRCRNAVAEQLLPDAARREFSPAEPEPHADRVKSVAQLLWEAAGRPDGSSEDDWHRAEEIIRRSRADLITAA